MLPSPILKPKPTLPPLLQVNWLWNANDLTLTSSALAPDSGRFYEQRRKSGQHAVVFDALVYFRRVSSTIRPYLGTGLSMRRHSTQFSD